MTDTRSNDRIGELRDRAASPASRASAALAALVASLLFAAPAPGRAHEGHDHAARPASNASAASSLPSPGPTASAPRPPATAGDTARFAAQSDQLELVGVLDGTQLTLWVDRFSDNGPIVDADVEVEINGTTLTAQRAGDVYVVVLPARPAPGQVPVSVTVVSPQVSDLLAGSLLVGTPMADSTVSGSRAAEAPATGATPAEAAQRPQRDLRAITLVAALVGTLAGAAGWLGGRYRRPPSKG